MVNINVMIRIYTIILKADYQHNILVVGNGLRLKHGNQAKILAQVRHTILTLYIEQYMGYIFLDQKRTYSDHRLNNVCCIVTFFLFSLHENMKLISILCTILFLQIT